MREFTLSRHATERIHNKVSVYFHLPSGTSVLEDKWVLARLLGSSLFNINSTNDDEGGGESPSGRRVYECTWFSKKYSVS